MGLECILKECRNSTGRDYEGDDTYRVHCGTAQDFIKRAYELGKSESNSMIENVLKMAYRKHVRLEDVIGWDELGDRLHDALCASIGDDGFTKWNDELGESK